MDQKVEERGESNEDMTVQVVLMMTLVSDPLPVGRCWVTTAKTCRRRTGTKAQYVVLYQACNNLDSDSRKLADCILLCGTVSRGGGS